MYFREKNVFEYSKRRDGYDVRILFANGKGCKGKASGTMLVKTILAIESSCDETSVAIVYEGHKVLANLVSSQIKAHQKYGGVVPELASRMHAEKINFLLEEALSQSQLTWDAIDAVAVTYGPGLEGALLIGVVAAKTISFLRKIPLIGMNHLHGHIYANFLLDERPSFPFLTLVVSGGHTQLVRVIDHFKFELLGATRDDAAGESFDKIARFLGLGYPGGPVIEKTALTGNSKAFRFPRAMMNDAYEFSFSGLKTAVIQEITRLRSSHTPFLVEDICASFQKAVIDVLLFKSIKACDQYGISQLVLSGGVTANKALRTTFEVECKQNGIRCFVPPFAYCTDNAAMIGAGAYYRYLIEPEACSKFAVNPNLPLCS